MNDNNPLDIARGDISRVIDRGAMAPLGPSRFCSDPGSGEAETTFNHLYTITLRSEAEGLKVLI